MDDARKKQLLDTIKVEIGILKNTIDGLRAAAAPVAPDSAIGRLTRMEAIAEQGVQSQNLAKSMQRLDVLRRSIARMDDTEFGYCEQCGDEIPFERLKIMPESRKCVPCLNEASAR